MSYFDSIWGISTDAVILTVFGLASYDKYARRWSARSGVYSVPGKNTWHEIIYNRRALISYSYRVDEVLFNGEIRIPPLNKEKLITRYPKGTTVKAYYSPKDPGFSRVDTPPDHFDIVGTTVFWYLLLPFVLLNIVSGFLYGLVNVGGKFT